MKEEIVPVEVLASVLNSIPGKCIDIHTDLMKVAGKAVVTQEIDENTLRIALVNKEGDPVPVPFTESEQI